MDDDQELLIDTNILCESILFRHKEIDILSRKASQCGGSK